MRDRNTAEEQAGPMQGARRWTQSWDSKIMPWAEGRHSTAEPLRHPNCPQFRSAARGDHYNIQVPAIVPVICCRDNVT